MFGLFFGTVCLVLLIASVRRWRYAGFGHHYGYHHGPYAYRHGPPWRGGFKRQMAQRLLERLDTTPGQEKVLRATFETLQESLRDGRDELKAARQDLALALGGDELDRSALSAALSKQETFVNRARGEIVQALETVHQTLDGKQRKTLAEWIADGPSFRDLRGYGW